MSNPRLKNTRDIGALIRRRRKDMGIDQAALADKIGVSRAWVIKVERGHPNAQIGLVLRLLNYLDVPLNASLDDVDADNRGRKLLAKISADTVSADTEMAMITAITASTQVMALEEELKSFKNTQNKAAEEAKMITDSNAAIAMATAATASVQVMALEEEITKLKKLLSHKTAKS